MEMLKKIDSLFRFVDKHIRNYQQRNMSAKQKEIDNLCRNIRQLNWDLQDLYHSCGEDNYEYYKAKKSLESKINHLKGIYNKERAKIESQGYTLALDPINDLIILKKNQE